MAEIKAFARPFLSKGGRWEKPSIAINIMTIRIHHRDFGKSTGIFLKKT